MRALAFPCSPLVFRCYMVFSYFISVERAKVEVQSQSSLASRVQVARKCNFASHMREEIVAYVVRLMGEGRVDNS